MWQNIAVVIIGILAVIYVGVRVYLFVTRPKSQDPCAGCPGCAAQNDKKDCK